MALRPELCSKHAVMLHALTCEDAGGQAADAHEVDDVFVAGVRHRTGLLYVQRSGDPVSVMPGAHPSCNPHQSPPTSCIRCMTSGGSAIAPSSMDSVGGVGAAMLWMIIC